MYAPAKADLRGIFQKKNEAYKMISETEWGAYLDHVLPFEHLVLTFFKLAFFCVIFGMRDTYYNDLSLFRTRSFSSHPYARSMAG